MNRKENRLPQAIYLFLLCYTVAALVFWGFSLHRQSRIIHQAQVQALPLQIDSLREPERYRQKLAEYAERQQTRTKQYLGEGGTFLVIIIIGAVVVYSAFQRSLRLSRQQNNFMLAVTHELKTPIAAVKLNLQTLQLRKLSPEQQALLLERCVVETNRLNDLCNNLLITSQLEERQYKDTREQLDLSALADQCVHDYESRYPQRLQARIVPEVQVWGDRLLLQMALNNLVENALKYSPATEAVSVLLEQQQAQAVLRVADRGMGIPDTEKAQVFQKFYRIGNEDTRRTKGTGLGLYLTRKIVEQHRGSIGLTDNEDQGSVFEIRLPLA